MTTVRRMYTKEHPWNDIGRPTWKWFDLGFECVGHGSRSSVFIHPSRPDVAIKVGMYDVADAGTKRAPQDAWLTYVLAGMHWGDKKVPKVYSVTMYRQFYVAVMERCYPLGYGRLERTVKAITCLRNRFARRLNDLRHETGLHLDLECSANNVMRRKNREVVVTDPLYCRSKNNRWSS